MASLDDEFFVRSQERVRVLQSKLSRDALEELAREVVGRLAARNGVIEPDDPARPAPADIDVLCGALVARDAEDARQMMLQLQANGLALEHLYARYLAPAAERLGAMWDSSDIGFMEVTLGVGRIFELVRVLRDRLPPTRITQKEPVLFATVPGDHHGLGIDMATELFRQNGWDVRLMVGVTHDQIMDEIEEVACLVVGLSSGGSATAEALARLVHAVRVAYPEIFIIVSGHIVLEEPDLIELMAPDSAVTTVEDALRTMERLSNGLPLGR